MASGIKKRSGSDYSDGRPGRINYHSEDEYRTVTLTLQATAEDMHDITHLRDAVNELFDGELLLREKRIKSVEVEYESMGQRTGELQLEAPEYVNGKQIKVAMVNSPEIDDTALVSTFTVEFETTESPYFETIYTTLELHDSGYSATAEKYGLVDNIDDEKVKYRFTPGASSANLYNYDFEYGFISSSTGADSPSDRNIRMSEYYYMFTGVDYEFIDTGNNPNVLRYYLYEYDGSGNFIKGHTTGVDKSITFKSEGSRLRIMAQATSGETIDINGLGNNILPRVRRPNVTNSFTVYNAGNVTVEPESSYLEIIANTVVTSGGFTITNKTTGDEFIFNAELNGLSLLLKGMDVRVSSVYNRFRDTNRRFIRLAPGDNEFEVKGGTFNHIRFDFKYLYK